MNEVVKKRVVPPVLRTMKVGGEEYFPIEQYSSIIAAIRRLKTEMLRCGADWEPVINEWDFTVKVIRIS